MNKGPEEATSLGLLCIWTESYSLCLPQGGQPAYPMGEKRLEVTCVKNIQEISKLLIANIVLQAGRVNKKAARVEWEVIEAPWWASGASSRNQPPHRIK